jgi:hypothetical protein
MEDKAAEDDNCRQQGRILLGVCGLLHSKYYGQINISRYLLKSKNLARGLSKKMIMCASCGAVMLAICLGGVSNFAWQQFPSSFPETADIQCYSVLKHFKIKL